MAQTLTPNQFIDKWRSHQLNERAAYQQHFLDLCAVNLHNPPGAADAEFKQRTLTDSDNLKPTWLQNAHRKLDQAVFAAYGWPDGLSDEEILERLLELNLQRASVKA